MGWLHSSTPTGDSTGISRYQLGSVWHCLGALAGWAALLFIEKHGDVWESGKKFASWSSRVGKALKGRRGLAADEEEFALVEGFSPSLMSSWSVRSF